MSRKAGVVALSLAFLLSAIGQPAEGRRKKRRRRAAAAKKVPAKATKLTKAAVGRLLKPYKWGMSSSAVMGVINKDVTDAFAPQLKKASKEPLEYDRLRREMSAELTKTKKSIVSFDGKKTGWDVSLIDGEFAHKNSESVLVRWGDDDRRFYFFHHGKLWKVYIAFNASRFAGKTFEDFAQVMETRFGRAERKYKATVAGTSKMAYLHWPSADGTLLRAVDNTAMYGNFCLVLLDNRELARVQEGRRFNSPKKNYNDPLVEAVVAAKQEQQERGTDLNDDVVDTLTGKGARAPGRSDTYAAPAQAEPAATTSGSRRAREERGSAPRPRKKINPKNPLDGLDL